MKLIIVSNRLPITLMEESGTTVVKTSGGGLASAINSFTAQNNDLSTDFVWIGWPGNSKPFKDRVAAVKRIKEFKAHPVFLTQAEVGKFYLGFCNKTIWPLFHDFTNFTEINTEFWECYLATNQKFADQVTKIAKPGDTVWVHDYHLMLLPEMLKKARPDLKVGFFLHIPFPRYEIFRMLPYNIQLSILKGLLGADLVGFQTKKYTQNFINSAAKILGFSDINNKIKQGSHVSAIGTYPIQIDYNRFAETAKSTEVKTEIANFSKELSSEKIILSIDRLDYSKGVVNRLMAFEKFLQNNPNWLGRVKLALVVVPSREEIDKYAQTKEKIEELVSKINTNFGRQNWQPIWYQYTSYSLEPLVALYNLADVALVTPFRDGMNLIAKEYIASKNDNHGVLVLSSKAGAAEELTQAISINPRNIEEISLAIKRGLEMPKTEQKARMINMKRHLRQNQVVEWAESMLRDTQVTSAYEKAGEATTNYEPEFKYLEQ